MHVEIASKLNKIIDDKDLTDLGKLEQDLVFGDATSKEIITYISTNQKMSTEDKVGQNHSCLLILLKALIICISTNQTMFTEDTIGWLFAVYFLFSHFAL